jgi:hypothetical protein
MDGNFHQKHKKSARDYKIYYDPIFFLHPDKVNNVGIRIDEARKRAPRNVPEGGASEAAIDSCERSHEAVDGRKAKADCQIFDDTGVFAMCCRHDIPILLANIDTPREQQKYPVVLLEELFENIPKTATVTALYDVGCVLHHSCQKVCIERVFRDLF